MPKLRFPGFEGEWTRNRLDEVASVNPASPEIPLHFYYIDLESVDAGILSEIKEITKSDAPSRAQREVRINDILFQTVRPYQKNNYFMQEEFGLPVFASTGYAQIRTENNPYFLYSLLHTKRFLNNVLLRCTGSSYPAINSNDLKEIEIYTPCQLEQSKLSLFMSLIDKRIEKQKQLIETVKKYKRGLLSSMFPEKGEAIPKHRFSGFTEPWEQRKLSELIIEYKETVESDCELPVLTSSKTEGVLLQEEHFGRKQSHDITGYNVLPRNYCTYRNRSDGIDFTFNINKCCDKGIISKFYPVFCGNGNDTFFISLMLNNSDEVVREIGYTCIGTGQKVLAFSDLLKMYLRVPIYEEQKKIAAYFDNLDHLITLHHYKLKMAIKLKESLLQQLFI